MSPFQVITHYLCQQLAPGTAAVVSGRRGCGKTQIMKQVGASFDGAVLYIVALPDQDLLVVDSRGSCGFFAGEQISARQIWTWFLTRKSSADISWMLVIDNAHLLKSLTTIVDTFQREGTSLKSTLRTSSEDSISCIERHKTVNSRRGLLDRASICCSAGCNAPASSDGTSPPGTSTQTGHIARNRLFLRENGCPTSSRLSELSPVSAN